MDDYMVAIINGQNEGDIDGNIDYVGRLYLKNDTGILDSNEVDLDKYRNHVDHLLKYGRGKYPNKVIFNKMPDNVEFRVPIFFLSILDNIVYLNVSTEKYGRHGWIFMPDEVSDKQKETLYEFARKLSNVGINLFYDLNYNEEGYVEFQEYDCKNGLSFEEILDDYFEMTKRYEKNLNLRLFLVFLLLINLACRRFVSMNHGNLECCFFELIFFYSYMNY